MSEDKIKNVALKEAVPPLRSPRLRLGVSLTSAFLLHQSIYAVGTAIVAAGEKAICGSHIFEYSPASIPWLIGWVGGTAFFWECKKPRLMEWSTPLSIFAGYWLLIATLGTWSSAGNPVGPSSPINVAFALVMSLCCSGTWSLALLVEGTGFVVGDGHQQKELLKRWASNVIPAFKRYHGAPEDILARISSAPEAPPELLAQPTLITTDTAPQQVLRIGQLGDQERVSSR